MSSGFGVHGDKGRVVALGETQPPNFNRRFVSSLGLDQKGEWPVSMERTEARMAILEQEGTGVD